MEIVVGHCMFVGLLRRESVSVFNACYKLIQKYGESVAPLWDSVRAEFSAFRGLLPLLEADWTMRWAERVLAYDA